MQIQKELTREKLIVVVLAFMILSFCNVCFIHLAAFQISNYLTKISLTLNCLVCTLIGLIAIVLVVILIPTIGMVGEYYSYTHSSAKITTNTCVYLCITPTIAGMVLGNVGTVAILEYGKATVLCRHALLLYIIIIASITFIVSRIHKSISAHSDDNRQYFT